MIRLITLLVAVALFPVPAIGLDVPGFARSIPVGHFLGISPPCALLDEARSAALLDVKRQILGAMNGQFSATETFNVSGSPQSPRYQVHGHVQGNSTGTVFGVENRIANQAHTQDGQGRFIYFILVRFPDSRIAEMTRLSKGAKLVARLVSVEEGIATVRLGELNGVRTTIDRIKISVTKNYRFADTISYYVMHVPSETRAENEIMIDQVVVQGSSIEFGFPIPVFEETFIDYALGIEMEGRLVFTGTDELGRFVAAELTISH